ncbi:SDR family oxidoreductase [Modestobacter sp. Leaf380]|uniref:SDR family oxidoreductase n=1 Tax=Modestobacter sp. Leaf380 TaxID=1736356 RepID=UPI0006FEBDE0|nr:hypothetical protein [Modestobacter sp. Leaf380]KQS71223.1 hypothetical protein ASG41_20775 [Modestobacter sp. Leaf380]
MTHPPRNPLVLLTGGTGTTGRRVDARLRARGATTRVASRAGDPAFSWQDRSTWSHLVEGATAAYLCFSPDLAVPGAADTVAEFARCATAHGVPRLVLLSGRGEPGAQRGEQLVRAAAEDGGASWTVVRAAWFAQDFAESFLVDQVRSGVVRLPVDDVREPFVDVDDVADVVAAALLDPGHDREVYEVTGPRALTFGEALAHVAAAAGRPLRLETLTRAEHLRGLQEAGVGDDVSWLMDHLFTEVLDGRNTHLADGVVRALGRPPRDFTAHLPAAAATGCWAAPA